MLPPQCNASQLQHCLALARWPAHQLKLPLLCCAHRLLKRVKAPAPTAHAEAPAGTAPEQAVQPLGKAAAGPVLPEHIGQRVASKKRPRPTQVAQPC